LQQLDARASWFLRAKTKDNLAALGDEVQDKLRQSGLWLSSGQQRLCIVPGTLGGDGSVKKVLFVCVENSNRSQMAEAFARIHGAGKVEAFSAGSRPSGRVNPRAVEAMREVGYDLTSHTSKGLDDFNGKEIDVAVTMGCGDECPLVLAQRRADWQIPDPRDMTPDDFRGVRNLIEAKVRVLIASL
jgi:protein-tyrosine-phosphatase